MSDREFPDRNEIEVEQLTRLRTLIGAISAGNAFYGPRLRRAGIGTDVPTVARYREVVGYTRKEELVADQAAAPPFGTNLTYPLDRYTRYHQTSGTTGAPLRWLDTPESWDWMVGNWQEIFLAAGVGRGDRIFFAFSFGPFIGFWLAFAAGERLGCLCIPGGGMTSAARLRTIIDNRCTVLCCTPTYAIRLGEAAREESIDLGAGAVRRLIVAGEPGASVPATRARIERLWPGASVCDHHGMTEVGPVSFECPARPGVLHVIERAFLPEVVDRRTGALVPPGGRGELVLTALGREGSPLLRYLTGDLVELDDKPAGQRCDCGRCDLALVGGIIGRTDDMVVVRGVNIHPSAVDAVIQVFEDVAEYRVRIAKRNAMLEIEIDLEPSTACAEPARLSAAVEAALRDTFNLRIPVTPAPCGSLPRYEMKARRWVREVDENREAACA